MKLCSLRKSGLRIYKFVFKLNLAKSRLSEGEIDLFFILPMKINLKHKIQSVHKTLHFRENSI